MMKPSTIYNTTEHDAATMEKLVGDLSKTLQEQQESPKELTEEDTTKLTHQLKPELLQASRLRRRMKRDLLLKVEEEQQHIARYFHHQRSLSANSARNLFNVSTGSMRTIVDDQQEDHRDDQC